MYIWQVTVEDLSNLGGPMGTERVVPIRSKSFVSKTKANAWILKDAKKRGVTPFKMCYNYKDCGSIGYDLRRVRVEE